MEQEQEQAEESTEESYLVNHEQLAFLCQWAEAVTLPRTATNPLVAVLSTIANQKVAKG